MHCSYTHVHFIGLGGIHVSALAKLVLSLGVSVSGSDLEENEQVKDLRERGVEVQLGHRAEHVLPETQVVVFSSAANETNPERIEAKRRGLPSFNSHEFLGELGKSMKQIVVTGTHGKSTTTAMLALMAQATGADPTTVVGTRVPQFSQGNLEIGTSDWLIVEGDEFDHHFLAYQPTVLVINNIEGDHFDIYPTIEAMLDAYRRLLKQVVQGGTIIANADDAAVTKLLQAERAELEGRAINICTVGENEGAQLVLNRRRSANGRQIVEAYSYTQSKGIAFDLQVPGAMNAMNALMCYAVGEALGWRADELSAGLASFRGIWRRLERIGEKDGVTVFSDYGHHPTAVTKTLSAIKEFYPDRRLVLCMQPHHRNRTKHLFAEFIPCFDAADVLILCEIYDVKGRDQAEDEAVSSNDLVAAIQIHDEGRAVSRTVLFTETPDASLAALRDSLQSGDVVVIMGAGDLYKIAYALV